MFRVSADDCGNRGEEMRRSNFKLLLIGSIVSIGTAAGTLALDHAGVISLIPTPEMPQVEAPPPIAAALPMPAPRRAIDMLAYLAPGSAPLQLPSPQETFEEVIAEAEQDSETEGTAVLDAWLTETEEADDVTAGSPSNLSGQSRPRHTPRHTPALARRLAQISPAANMRLAAKFKTAGFMATPAEVGLVAIKDERTIELHARTEGGDWTFIHRYPVLAASGGLGPKLRQGDKQVPEGVYNISFLNPQSRYHVSLRVNYPNAFDRKMAAADGRRNLGGDIMIHGKAVSAGCLAVGDEAAEELFVLAAQTGLPNIRLVIAPTDLRRRSAPSLQAGDPSWLPKLHSDVQVAMADFNAPPRPVGLLSSFFGN